MKEIFSCHECGATMEPPPEVLKEVEAAKAVSGRRVVFLCPLCSLRAVEGMREFAEFESRLEQHNRRN